jgi:hypothetical protein
MTTTATNFTSTALATTVPVLTAQERLALAGFLAGYAGLTREAYTLDLRQFAGWCRQHDIRLFGARRADIECFARDLEARGRARATVTRRLCTIAGFYRYAAGEELLDHSPATSAGRGPSHTNRRSARAAVRLLSGCRRRRSVDLRAGWSSPSRGSSADSERPRRRLSLASLSRFGHRGDRPPRCRIAFGGTGVVLASRRWRW